MSEKKNPTYKSQKSAVEILFATANNPVLPFACCLIKQLQSSEYFCSREPPAKKRL